MNSKRSGPQQHGYQQRGPRIELSLVGPNENNDVTAIANVSYGDNPAEDTSIEFFHSKMDEPDFVEITKGGRAVANFLGLKSGAHTFEARILGSTKRDSKPLRIDPPPVKKDGKEIAKLIVEPYRVGDSVYITAHVVNADGHGIKDAKISIFDSMKLNFEDGDPDNDKHRATRTCDENGSLLYSFKMEEGEEREIGISAFGVDIKSYRHTWRGREVPEDDPDVQATAVNPPGFLRKIWAGVLILVLVGAWVILSASSTVEILFWFLAICGATFLLYYGAHNLQRYNNRILLGLVALTIALTITAAIKGGGGGILTEPSSPIHITNQYIDPKIFADDMPFVGEMGTWFWWKIQLYVLLTTIIFIPVAFSDEIKNQFFKLSDMLEQKRRVFTKEKEIFEDRPASSREQQGAQPAPEKKKMNIFEKFFTEITKHWESAVFFDLAFDFLKRVF